MFGFSKKTLFAILAGLAIIVGTIAGLTACSGGSSPSGPPSATSVLQSDGYTYDSALTGTVQSEIGAQGSSVGLSSLAVGSQGSNLQLVMVFGTPAEATEGAAGVGNSAPGITVTTNGDVLTATGSGTSFANFSD